MNNYYYKIEVTLDNAVAAKIFNSENQDLSLVELRSKYFLTEAQCISAILVDINAKVILLEEALNMEFDKLSAANPMLYEDTEESSLDPAVVDFWKNRLGFFAISNKDNDVFYLRYSVYCHEDTLNIDEVAKLTSYTVHQNFYSSMTH